MFAYYNILEVYRYMWKIGLEMINSLYTYFQRNMSNIAFLMNTNKLKKGTPKKEIEAAELFF